MKTIGQMMALAVDKRAEEKGITAKEECNNLGIPHETYRDWKKRILCPSSFYLKRLAHAGYDVMWILLGDESQ
jgi:hypothetical protein